MIVASPSLASLGTMIPTEVLHTGSRVSYQGQGRPRQLGTVVSVEPDDMFSSWYTVDWDEDRPSTVTKLDQPQWSLVADGSWAGTPFEGADIISVYSRAQAIEDGTLVDVSEMAREAGFRYPFAVTSGVWASCVDWPEGNAGRATHQDVNGRLWDCLWMTHCATARSKDGEDRVDVALYVVPNQPKATKARLVHLTAVCGGGDQGEPVITLMLPGED